MSDMNAFLEKRNAGLAPGQSSAVATQSGENLPTMLQSVKPTLMLGSEVLPDEPRHVLCVGAPGSGKTMAFHQIFSTVSQRGEPCILIDHSAEFLQRHYNPDRGDLVFNPFDSRSVGWSPFNELQYIYDFDRIACAIVPDLAGENNQDWQKKAQHLLADVMCGLWDLGKQNKAFRTNKALIDALTILPKRKVDIDEADGKPKFSLEEICESATTVRSTSGNLFLNEKSLGITLDILSDHIKPLTYLKEGDFSITKHVMQFETPGDYKGWLFLSYTDSSYAAIRSLFSILVSSAVQASLLLTTSDQRRFYFSLDEFGSLDAIPAIDDAMTKLRKKGGVLVCGTQSTAMFERAYGKVGAQILLACFAHVLMLKVADHETAETLSAMLGEIEIEETSRNQGTSSSGGKDGWSVSEGTSTQKVIKRAMLSSEFMGLEKLTGFVRIDEKNNINKTRIPISHLPIIAPAEITMSNVMLDLN